MNETNSMLEFLSSLSCSKPKQIKCKNEELKGLYSRLTLEFSLQRAKQSSREERCLNKLTSGSYSYGEIDFDSLQEAINIARPQSGGIFYDLGSGSGKGVIGIQLNLSEAASMLHSFTKCCGVELLGSLHRLSLNLKDKVITKKEEIMKEMKTDQLAEIEFHKADIREFDWSDGSFIFASTTCYDPSLMQVLNKKAMLLKEGTIFVTLTKRLDGLQLLQAVKVNMSWGDTTMYVQRLIQIQ